MAVIKSDIVYMLSKRFPQLMHDDVNLSVNIILNEIGNALQQGRKAEFREFGVFTTQRKSSRVARNPKTGASLITQEKTVPRFKPSIFLNRRLNNLQKEQKIRIKANVQSNDSRNAEYL